MRPSCSVSVIVSTACRLGHAFEDLGVTSRSFGTISRYSPWKATSKPSFADHHVAPAAADPQVDLGW